VPAAAYFAGDINADGKRLTDDRNFIRAALFGANDDTNFARRLECDLDFDGFITPRDLMLWNAAYNSGQ